MSKLTPSKDMILVGSAVAIGWWAFGWRGLVLAITLIAFWLILQFRRATRLLTQAAQRPKGSLTQSVMMVQAALAPGMTLGEVIAITGSLGERVNEHRDDWRWVDPGGEELVVSLRREVVVRWAVTRQDEDQPK